MKKLSVFRSIFSEPYQKITQLVEHFNLGFSSICNHTHVEMIENQVHWPPHLLSITSHIIPLPIKYLDPVIPGIHHMEQFFVVHSQSTGLFEFSGLYSFFSPSRHESSVWHEFQYPMIQSIRYEYFITFIHCD